MYRGGVLTLGPVSLPYTWLFLGTSLLAGYALFTVLMRKKTETRKVVGSLLVNTLLIFIAAWKVSPLLFQWKAVTNSLTLLLYLPGGLPGSILGIAAAGTYLFFAVKKRNISWKQFGLPLAAAAGSALMLGLFFNFILLQPAVSIPESAASAMETGNQPGQRAPDFTAESVNGTVVSLSDYRGQLVFLNFWATWCPPCKAEIPEMVRFYGSLGEEPVEILAINVTGTEKNIQSVITFTRVSGINYPVVLDKGDLSGDLYSVSSLPTTILINPEGIILTRKTGSISETWMNRQLQLSGLKK